MRIPKYSKSDIKSRDFLIKLKKEFYNGNPIKIISSYQDEMFDHYQKYLRDLYYDIESKFYQDHDFSKFMEYYYAFKKNYDFRLRWLVHESIVYFLIHNSRPQEAFNEWKIIKEDEWDGWNRDFSYRESEIHQLMKFEILLNKSAIDGYLINKIAHKGSQLTSFGKRNSEAIFKVITKIIHTNYDTSFFEGFYKNYSLQRLNKTTYALEYYERFFIHNNKYMNKWSSIIKLARNKTYGNLTSKRGNANQTIVYEAIRSEASRLIREAENDYRIAIGAKKIGEEWISETELYYNIKKYFSNLDVIHHGRPKWLGSQHVDIWMPKYKIGIEYQGLQHDSPVEFFGGKDAFAANKDRDQRKRILFEKNEAHLIEVRPGYDLGDVIDKITMLI